MSITPQSRAVVTYIECEKTAVQGDKGIVPRHTAGKHFSQDSGTSPLSCLGKFSSVSLLRVGLVGEAGRET